MGIRTCHDAQILHRDIKSHNIFLTKSGQVKLGDFGVSKILQHSKSAAMTTVGTPYYLCPEIINGQTYRYQSDIWSLGILLYELTTLNYPFKGQNKFDLFKKINKGRYNPLPN